jgi:putative transposase
MQLDKLRQGRHSVSRLVVHLVFTIKYRRKVLSAAHLERMREVCHGVAQKLDCVLLELSGEADQAHLLVEYPPRLSVTAIVNAMKGVSSRMLRKEFPGLLEADHLWSAGYFAGSREGAPIAVVRQCIEGLGGGLGGESALAQPQVQG